MSVARDEILLRVRAALDGAPRPVPEIPRRYLQHGSLDPTACVPLLVDRLRDYKAAVRMASEEQLPHTIAEALGAAGVASLAVPAGIEAAWLSRVTGVELRHDLSARPLTATELDNTDATLTSSALAIAQTGTIVLDSSPGQGRRVLSLVPDFHLCVVFTSDIVETVPEALRRLDALRPQTWISGPSATSDIELQRVEGVHGPRRLEVILVT